MYLVDSNIFLEIFLDQERAAQAKLFFKDNDTSKFCISDLSFYSIGIILFRNKKNALFDNFLTAIYVSDVEKISLPAARLNQIKIVSEKFNLDFEDSYQYLVAQEFNLQLVTFDNDFNKTDVNRFKI